MIIPFLAVAAVLGVVAAFASGWRRHYPADRPTLPRRAWLLPLAIGLQVLWTRWLSHQGPAAAGFAWILPLSYVPVFGFLAANLRLAWARVISVGVCLNVAVMLLNGGTMPAPSRFAAAPDGGAGAVTRLAPGTKDRVFTESSPAILAPLQDQYVISLPGGGQRLASIGDVVSLGGAILGLVSAL